MYRRFKVSKFQIKSKTLSNTGTLAEQSISRLKTNRNILPLIAAAEPMAKGSCALKIIAVTAKARFDQVGRNPRQLSTANPQLLGFFAQTVGLTLR